MNEQENKEKQEAQRNSGSLLMRGIIMLLVIVAICVLFWAVSSSAKGDKVSYDSFVNQVYNGQIERVEIGSKQITYKTKDNKWHWFYNRDSIEQDVVKVTNDYNTNVVDKADPSMQLTHVKVVPGTTSTFSLLSVIYPILLLVVGIMLVTYVVRQFKSMSRNNMDFVKNRARIIPSKVKFDKVAGADEEKAELEEIIEFLRDPDKFTKMGARIPKGFLLVGPPGTGKTLLAKAVAGEANVPFFTISGSDFMELYVGVGASRVRDLFENAKKAKPCIVFIDEIDAIGRQRGTGVGGGSDEREQTLNQLLVHMDGFEQNEGIIVMAATNRADILDPALTRPGRFDRQIYVGRPDVKGREEILRVHSTGKPLASDVNLKDIARVTIGFTGADIENLLNEAAILAAKSGRSEISMEDINKSIVKVAVGTAKPSSVVSQEDKKMTAFHEAGHAIVGMCVKNSHPVHEVSIIRRGGAAGYTLSRPEEDNSHMTRQKLLDQITMTLGGRGAEMLFLDDITAGASADIKQATDIARAMITEYGMSEVLGPINFGGEGGYAFIGRDYQDRVSYSEKEAAIIDSEIKKIIGECLESAKQILSKNKKQVETMVDVLMAKETIYSEDVELIMKGASKDKVISEIEKRVKTRDEESKKRAELNRKQEEEQRLKQSDHYIDELLRLAEERAARSQEKSSAASEKEGDSSAKAAQPALETQASSETDKSDKKPQSKRQSAAKPQVGQKKTTSSGDKKTNSSAKSSQAKTRESEKAKAQTAQNKAKPKTEDKKDD